MYQERFEHTEHNIYPVFIARKQLESGQYLQHLTDIKALSGLSDDVFNDVYMSLLEAFVNKVQSCPDAHMNNQSWVSVSLERAKIALNLAHASETMDERMMYAAFSATLCLMMGRLVTEIQVSLTDGEGRHHRSWLPLNESLHDATEYYRVRPMIGMPLRLAEALTPLLARSVMPDMGITWLADDPVLMLQWLSTLMQQQSDAGELGAICARAEQRLHKQTMRIQGIPIDPFVVDDLSEIEAFWAWLKAGLTQNQFAVNAEHALIHKLKDGSVFLREGIFKAYVESIEAKSSDWTVLVSQFNYLGLSKLSGHDAKFEQHFGRQHAKDLAGSGFVSSFFSQKSLSSADDVSNVMKKSTTEYNPLWAQQQHAVKDFSAVAAIEKALQQSNQHNLSGVSIAPGNLLLPSNLGTSAVLQSGSGASATAALLQHRGDADYIGVKHQQTGG